MKYLLAGPLLLVGVTGDAATPLPPELIGIGATSGSQFHGDAVWTGQAIYLDSDDVGAIAGGDGSDVLGVRIAVTFVRRHVAVIGFDLTENGEAARPRNTYIRHAR